MKSKGKQVKKGNPVKYRNPFHDHPLMKKGGVHEKPGKSKRHAMKVQLKKGEWYDQSAY